MSSENLHFERDFLLRIRAELLQQYNPFVNQVNNPALFSRYALHNNIKFGARVILENVIGFNFHPSSKHAQQTGTVGLLYFYTQIPKIAEYLQNDGEKYELLKNNFLSHLKDFNKNMGYLFKIPVKAIPKPADIEYFKSHTIASLLLYFENDYLITD